MKFKKYMYIIQIHLILKDNENHFYDFSNDKTSSVHSVQHFTMNKTIIKQNGTLTSETYHFSRLCMCHWDTFLTQEELEEED